MSKKIGHKAENGGANGAYKDDLHNLQIELVKLQRHVIAAAERVLVILEGRDTAGKDGTIKRITAHLSPRDMRVVALGKPSDRERSQWYFQRYAEHLPAAGEIVLFNRSWYNRAGVERVMGFCTGDEYQRFMQTVPDFEQMLVRSGIQLVKYYLDISRNEQAKRLADRRDDPLKQWKISPIDEVAAEKWDEYTRARDDMFAGSHREFAPWVIVKADDKRTARLELIRDLLSRTDYPDRNAKLTAPDRNIVFDYDPMQLNDTRLAQ